MRGVVLNAILDKTDACHLNSFSQWFYWHFSVVTSGPWLRNTVVGRIRYGTRQCEMANGFAQPLTSSPDVSNRAASAVQGGSWCRLSTKEAAALALPQAILMPEGISDAHSRVSGLFLLTQSSIHCCKPVATTIRGWRWTRLYWAPLQLETEGSKYLPVCVPAIEMYDH